MQIVIPEIGHNIKQAEILALLVHVGEHVRASQPILELEADKASFELPSPAAGRIEQIYVGIGDDVKVGDVVLMLRPAEHHDPLDDLGDHGLESAPEPAATEPVIHAQVEIDGQPGRRMPSIIRASPAARRRALELGVDLETLAESVGGRVTVEQIEAWAGGADSSPETLDIDDSASADDGGRVRRRTHESSVPLIQEWPRVPHVATHDALDVTCLEAARCRYRDEHETHGKLTLTAFVIKACAIALRQHPRMNSSLIRHGRALAVKRFVHIGVAVQTELGLVFPVIQHADRRPLRELAVELEALTAKAQSKSLVSEQLEGATFTVTNLRGFSGTKFTPIIEAPQVGALGLCRARTEGGRTLLPVSLAHDQRVNDESAATAFLATVAELLHDPLAMLLRA